jgi:NDP-sugar pyrophosphorylase family protein
LSRSGSISATAVVLAGGTSSRMGHLGALLPKALLPVSHEQTLLTRTLDHLGKAGISDVVVSTTPEHYPLFASLLARYLHVLGASRPSVFSRLELVANDSHARGSLRALEAIVEREPDKRYLMCFGDIYFRSNPYLAIVNCLQRLKNLGAVLAHVPRRKESLRRGGIAYLEGDYVTGFTLQPPGVGAGFPGQPALWSGGTLFEPELRADLAGYFADLSSTVEEDFLNYTVARGRRYVSVRAPSFVNVNSFGDFAEIIEFAANGGKRRGEL